MAGRKTVNVAEVVGMCNRILDSPVSSEEGRWVAVGIAESVLMSTGNYAGFRYLGSEYLPDGSGLRPDYDGSRRSYHVPARITR